VPNIASQIRQLRTDKKRTENNKNIRTRVKTDIKKAEGLIKAGKIEEAQKAVVEAVSQLDKAGVKKVLHKNNAARRKGRLVSKLAAAQKTKTASK
jgi:small subunit ribosomal protein S20